MEEVYDGRRREIIGGLNSDRGVQEKQEMIEMEREWVRAREEMQGKVEER